MSKQKWPDVLYALDNANRKLTRVELCSVLGYNVKTTTVNKCLHDGLVETTDSAAHYYRRYAITKEGRDEMHAFYARHSHYKPPSLDFDNLPPPRYRKPTDTTGNGKTPPVTAPPNKAVQTILRPGRPPVDAEVQSYPVRAVHKLDIASLNPGDVVRHVGTGNGYIVVRNDGGHCTAGRFLDVSNPDEWMLVARSYRE